MTTKNGTRERHLAMRVVMTLLVRDEIDIVAATIEHHLAAGVDFIVATDNGSRDGTVEVLERYRDTGMLELHHEPNLNYEQGRWVTRMARRVATEHGADWVINADADEFFWPADSASIGRSALPTALATIDPAYGTVEIPRDNLIAYPGVTSGWVHRLIIRDTESTETGSTQGDRLPTKTCHRADPNVHVAQGNHRASGPLIGPRAPHRPLQILHVPDRGYSHYRRKIANGGAAYAANTRLGARVGWHWRADYTRLLNGELPAAYAARQRDWKAIRLGITAGTLVKDTRLRDRLTTLLSNALIPAALQAVIDHQ